MKALIQNYASVDTTEPLYLSECLNSVGIETTTWKNQDVSAFDMFDLSNPNLFITHYNLVTNDIIKYLSGHHNIECILNITGASQEHIDMLDNMFTKNKIKCPFVFTNQPTKLNNLISRKIKLVSIMHGVDCFLHQQGIGVENFSIELGIITDYSSKQDLHQLTENYSTYHYVTHKDMVDADIVSPVLHLYPLYHNYLQTVIAYKDAYIPQSFFDAVFYGNEVYTVINSSQQSNRLSDALQSSVKTSTKLACTPSEVPKPGSINFNTVKQQITSNHTCFHRTKRLLSKLKCSEAENNMDQLIAKVCK